MNPSVTDMWHLTDCLRSMELLRIVLHTQPKLTSASSDDVEYISAARITPNDGLLGHQIA